MMYTKGEINLEWRSTKGNEKVKVGLAERKDSKTLLAALARLSLC